MIDYKRSPSSDLPRTTIGHPYSTTLEVHGRPLALRPSREDASEVILLRHDLDDCAAFVRCPASER
jgi:hypothetical protein